MWPLENFESMVIPSFIVFICVCGIERCNYKVMNRVIVMNRLNLDLRARGGGGGGGGGHSPDCLPKGLEIGYTE